MKLVKTASGKKTIKMSKKEWQDIGKKAGWMRESKEIDHVRGETFIDFLNEMYVDEINELSEDDRKEVYSLATRARVGEAFDTIFQDATRNDWHEFSDNFEKWFKGII